jgi:hypothetical protein
MSVSRVRESAPRMTRNLLVEVQRGQLLVQPVSEGRGAGERSPVSKPPDKGSSGVDANLQAATRVNPRVASSHRTPPAGGLWERRASSLGAKAATGAVRTSVAASGSPAYQGWHAGTVAGGNAGGPHASRPDLRPGNSAYKAAPEVAGDGRGGIGGERTSVDGQDNTTCPEQRLPASAVLVVCREGPTPVPGG